MTPTTRPLILLTSGDWRQSPHMSDYRSEWLSGMLVERATWLPGAPTQKIGAVVIASAGYTWFRFWLQEIEQVVEKYFDADLHPIGVFVPICAGWRRRDVRVVAPSLYLGLWIEPSGRVTVLNEKTFDAAAHSGELTPIEVEHAEHRIRELTTGILQKRFPPGLVKNLTL